MVSLKGLTIVLFVLLLPGCGGSAYDERVSAAMKIQNAEERSRALATIAEEAAQAGAGGDVESIIGKIQDLHIHDNTADACAAHLFRLGKRNAAMRVAQKIMQVSIRDPAVDRIKYAK